MPLLFPSADALKLAIANGLIPADVVAEPATVSEDDTGRIAVTPKIKLSIKKRNALEQFGIQDITSHIGATKTLAFWPQLFPAYPTTALPPLTAQSVVLFEIATESAFRDIILELLRLGNDRQSFQTLTSEDQKRFLLKVIGPPYYTVLRALDRMAGNAVRAYTEVATRVWVEIGFTHTLADKVTPAVGQTILLHAPNHWTFLVDQPFRDVYEQLHISLPGQTTSWVDSGIDTPIRVPLELRPANKQENTELWVLAGDGIGQLDSLIGDLDDKQVQRLRFAVATREDGTKTVLLRVIATRQSTSQFSVPGAAEYRSFGKLANLFIPLGTRLHPVLRRETIRSLLANDPDQIVWLSPSGNHGFTPQSIPEASFRRLDEWVNYIIDTEHNELSTWVQATRFDFAAYICKDGPTTKPRGPDKAQPKQVKEKVAPTAQETPSAIAEEKSQTVQNLKAQESGILEVLKAKRTRLEDAFLKDDGPLDRDDRIALWPELAAINAQLEDRSEAAINFQNALWYTQDEVKSLKLAQSWAAAEGHRPTNELLSALTANSQPTFADARGVVAVFMALPTSTALRNSLPQLHHYFENNESRLSTRAVWLAARRMNHLSGGDHLALIRTRDRLLRRLLDQGLNAEREIPSFLRLDGHKKKESLRESRERARALGEQTRSWVVASVNAQTGPMPGDRTMTPAYVEILFAYANARLGEHDVATRLVESAKKVLLTQTSAVTAEATVARLLFEGFRFRVEEAQSGKTQPGPLPQNWLAETETDKLKSAKDTTLYVIMRMREQSRVLDPFEKLNPYAAYTKHSEPLRKAIADLPNKRPEELGKVIQALWSQGVGTKPTSDDRFALLHQALPLAARVGEELTVELIDKIPEALSSVAGSIEQSLDMARKQAYLFDRGLFLAAHFGRADLVAKLTEVFTQTVRAKNADRKYELVSAVAAQGLRSLKKLGLNESAQKLLSGLQAEILPDNSLSTLRVNCIARPKVWAEALRAMLNLAGGWCGVGRVDLAEPAFTMARAELLPPAPTKFDSTDTVNVVRAYIAALGNAPSQYGIPRLMELFQKLPPAAVPVTFTSAKFFSRHHLNIAEDVVFAMTGDEFALDESGKHWRDDDERIVRNVIHNDVRQAMKSVGFT